MNRAQLEHLIRAAGRIADVREVLIIGSQTILGQHPDGLPVEAIRSMEGDIAVLDDTDGQLADRIDGAIGMDSLFHQQFGIYAHGVEVATAKLPSGWRDRLIRVPVTAHDGREFVGLCLEKHDLCASKLVAGRPHDIDFVKALLAAGLLDRRVLLTRVQEVEGVDSATAEAAAKAVRALGRPSP